MQLLIFIANSKPGKFVCEIFYESGNSHIFSHLILTQFYSVRPLIIASLLRFSQLEHLTLVDSFTSS